MLKKVLIIGAGASVGAREHLQKKPPLGLELLKFLRESLKTLIQEANRINFMEHQTIINDVHNILLTIAGNNFEKEILNLTTEQRDQIHRFLAIVFTDLTEEKLNFGFNNEIDKYDDVAKIISKDLKNTWSIISLNYDLLLEKAFERNSLNFHYDGTNESLKEEEKYGIPFYKPHGSINFYSKPDLIFEYDNQIRNIKLKPTNFSNLGNGNISVEFPIFFSGGTSEKKVKNYAALKTHSLVIANYAKNKISDFNLTSLENIRSLGLENLTMAEEVFICGINPSITDKDDPFMSKVFKILKTRSKNLKIFAFSESDEISYTRHFQEALIIKGGILELINEL